MEPNPSFLSQIAPSSKETALLGLEELEKEFGREWLERQLEHIGDNTEQLLGLSYLGCTQLALKIVSNPERLRKKLRRRSISGEAEVHGLFLLASKRTGCSYESPVRGHRKKPDFFFGHDSPPFYLEINRPRISKLHLDAYEHNGEIAQLFLGTSVSRKGFMAEVVLDKYPVPKELPGLLDEFDRALRDRIEKKVEFPKGFGHFQVYPERMIQENSDHLQINEGTSLGSAPTHQSFCITEDGARRQIFIDISSGDLRAKTILKNEVSQLPPNSLGVIMLDLSGPGPSILSWMPLIKREISKYPNVAAVVLFSAIAVQSQKLKWGMDCEAEVLNGEGFGELPDWTQKRLKSLPYRSSSELGPHGQVINGRLIRRRRVSPTLLQRERDD